MCILAVQTLAVVNMARADGNRPRPIQISLVEPLPPAQGPSITGATTLSWRKGGYTTVIMLVSNQPILIKIQSVVMLEALESPTQEQNRQLRN